MQTILVVDDDKDIVDSTCIYLQAAGYGVLKAYDGLSALDMLTENAVDLLILDIMMPERDGISTLL